MPSASFPFQENILMVDSTYALEMLEHIRRLGVRITIDDFGTGFPPCPTSPASPSPASRWTSPSSATSPPTTTTAPSPPPSSPWATASRSSLKASKPPEQVAFLLEHGCDDAQGFYFGAPSTPLPSSTSSKSPTSATPKASHAQFDWILSKSDQTAIGGTEILACSLRKILQGKKESKDLLQSRLWSALAPFFVLRTRPPNAHWPAIEKAII